MPNFVEVGQTAPEIWRLLDFPKWRPLPSCIFLKFLTVGKIKRVVLNHCAKFRRNRSNYGRDVAIFRFSMIAAAAILDFQILEILTVGTLKRANCVSVPNFFEIGQTAVDICRFFDFSRWWPLRLGF